MSIFNQTGDGDLALTDGKLTQVEGADETAIRVRNRMFSVKGEWFANAAIGIPYLELIFVKNPDLDIIKNVYTQAFSTIPGVAMVENVELEVDKDIRQLKVSAEIRHDSGALIVGGSGTPFVVEDV